MVETVGCFPRPRADPAGENVAPRSRGGDAGETVEALSLSCADPDVENEAPRSFGRDGLIG